MNDLCLRKKKKSSISLCKEHINEGEEGTQKVSWEAAVNVQGRNSCGGLD